MLRGQCAAISDPTRVLKSSVSAAIESKDLANAGYSILNLDIFSFCPIEDNFCAVPDSEVVNGPLHGNGYSSHECGSFIPLFAVT